MTLEIFWCVRGGHLFCFNFCGEREARRRLLSFSGVSVGSVGAWGAPLVMADWCQSPCDSSPSKNSQLVIDVMMGSTNIGGIQSWLETFLQITSITSESLDLNCKTFAKCIISLGVWVARKWKWYFSMCCQSRNKKLDNTSGCWDRWGDTGIDCVWGVCMYNMA